MVISLVLRGALHQLGIQAIFWQRLGFTPLLALGIILHFAEKMES
jgi:hypothetical protein